MNIYAFHDLSGCGFYRIKVPLGELAKHGHDVRLVVGSDVVASELSNYELIVGQRMDKHAALPTWRRLWMTSKLVYEIDDDVFSVDQTNWQAYGVFSRADTQDAVAQAAQVAHLVTVTTEHLADVMRQFNDNVKVLPNCVPDELFTMDRPHRDRLVVGWAGGASHARDIGEVAAPLRRFLQRNKNTELHLIGTDYRPTVRHEGRFTNWDNDTNAYYRNIDFDIGLAPLVDTRFNRSKSAIKALEYAALGIPVIASDVTPYREFVIDGVTGFLVQHEHQWAKRLHELANDTDMREEMGRNARQHAEQWSIGRQWTLWADAYEGLYA